MFISNEDGELQFLAAPDGRDVVEFVAGGDVKITTDDDDVYFYTAENEPTFTINEDAEVFTQIAQRAARNPEMEHMLYLQQINMERRFAQQEAEMSARFNEAYNAGRNVADANSTGTASAQNDAGQSKPDGNGSAPAEGAGQAPSVTDQSSSENGTPTGQASPAPTGSPVS